MDLGSKSDEDSDWAVARVFRAAGVLADTRVAQAREGW